MIRLVENLPLEFNLNLVFKFLKITKHQFNIWRSRRRYLCASSLIGYCTKRFPSQISQEEIKVLKSLMSRSRFSTWSIGNIWGFAFKRGMISMSRTSWYRYCLRLGISKKRNQEKQRRKRDSIKAKRPNEIWHMDVTEFITADRVKFYIHTVLDNFSRKIISYTISRDKTAKTRLISLKEGLKAQYKSEISNEVLDLIVDGGSENNNFRIHNFIRHCKVEIHKKVALKDIIFSNSMIEGSFKILKRFLRQRGSIYSNTIYKEVMFFVKDHNQHKPTYQYQFHTPDEIYANPKLVDVKPYLNKVNKERLEANRNYCCKLQ